ncbi:MAG: ThiF family adenylyltransferase [Acidobacteria bacterium]|nr:ThiF family adenylyltransferase [Acidobacteriota bacterium]
MAHVVVIGAGTIGSHLLPHVARMLGVTTVTVIDRDRYTLSNVGAQNIFTSDVGKSKAQVQCRRLKQIDRSLETRAFQKPVEDLPLGWLRADAILACLDSRRARMIVNQAAWRLGVPWINAGIDASGLARVQVFMPAEHAPCLECAWDASDYALVEQTYACQDDAAPPETGASSGLGALAAAVQALECEKLLAGDHDHLLAGRDVLLDTRHHRHYVTQFHRNSACRMPDHAGWAITPFESDPSSTTLEQLMAMAQTVRGSAGGVRMGVAGQQFVTALTCSSCGDRLTVALLNRGDQTRLWAPCAACGGGRTTTGFDLHDAVTLDAFPEEARRRSLSELGLLAGDVLTLSTPDIETHLELGGSVWPIAS